MRHTSAIVATALMLAATVTLTGCYDEREPTVEARPAPPPPAATEEGPVTGLGNRGGGSSLGKARQGAKNTVSAVEQRQAELEKQIEDDNN